MFAKMLPVHFIGGMEIHTWELVKGLVQQGVDVTIITGKHPNNIPYEEKDSIKIYYVGNRKPSEKL